MSLCARCKAINFTPPPQADAEPQAGTSSASHNSTTTLRPAARGEPHYTERKLIYVLHESQQSFLDSLATGCRFCLLISSKLVRPAGIAHGRDAYSQTDYANRLRATKTVPRRDDRPVGVDELIRSNARDRGASALQQRDFEAGDNFMVLRRAWPFGPRRQPGSQQESEDEMIAMNESASTSDVHVWSRVGSACLRVIDALPSKYEEVYIDSGNKASRKRTHSGFTSDSEDLPATGNSEPPLAEDSTGSKTNIRLARLWLNSCLESHELCNTGRSSGYRLPRRLIDVADARRPFLVNVSDLLQPQEDITYVALSYCWGEGKRVMTLDSNYKQHLHSLLVGSLPKTFADAFSVTRELGFQYVWVDAFAMIQDNWEDKKHELPKMGDIYRYAALTICAEGAPNAHAGLFKRRDSRTLGPCKIKLNISPDGKTTVSAVVTLATNCVQKDYLEPRGWILQEEILACRRLLFGNQMSWRCLHSTAAEVRPVLHPRRDISTGGQATPVDKLRMWLYEAPRMVAATPDRPKWSRSNHFDAWYYIIEFYSAKELTFVGDILNALEGLATMFTQAHGVTYLAGLYKEDLQLGLTWYACNNERRSVAATSGSFPTWSWASVGKVALRFRRWHAHSQHLVDEGATVLGAECESIGNSAVRGSIKLKLRAMTTFLRPWENRPLAQGHAVSRTRPGSRRQNDNELASFGERPRFPAKLYSDPEGRVFIGQVAMDKPFESAGVEEQTVVCALLHVQWSEDRGLFRTAGLLLQEAEDTLGEYNRKGLVFFDDVSKWSAHPLAGQEPKVIRVV